MMLDTYDRITGAVADAATGSTDRIAFIRTYAPAVWSMIVLYAADLFGLDVPGEIAGWFGWDESRVDTVAPLVLFAVLYAIGKRFPGKVEGILLGVAVESQNYTKRGQASADPGPIPIGTSNPTSASTATSNPASIVFDPGPTAPEAEWLHTPDPPETSDDLFDYDALPVTIDPEGPA